MDTYLRVSDKCQKCGLCVEACKYNAIYGGRNHSPSSACDNMPCNCCDEPCKKVCYYGAIDWTRY